MPKPYRMLIVLYQPHPETPEQIHCSNQMIGYGLWTEFAKLPHVQIDFQLAEPRDGNKQTLENELIALPWYDFILIHTYTPGPIFGYLDLLKETKCRKLIWMSENSFAGFNKCFTFLPPEHCNHFGRADIEQVPLPCLKDVLLNPTPIQRIQGSVLLDHAYNLPKEELWCDKLYNWLAPFNGARVVGQMESVEHERLAGVKIPSWVKRVPNSFYVEYLNNTQPYENYVMTHPGSYEHSIIDMVARGIRVLVPVMDGRTFAPKDTVERLGLPTFSNKEEFYLQLSQPHDGKDNKIDLCSDMSAIVSQVDDYCQRYL